MSRDCYARQSESNQTSPKTSVKDNLSQPATSFETISRSLASPSRASVLLRYVLLVCPQRYQKSGVLHKEMRATDWRSSGQISVMLSPSRSVTQAVTFHHQTSKLHFRASKQKVESVLKTETGSMNSDRDPNASFKEYKWPSSFNAWL